MNAPVLGDLFAAAMEGLAERYPERDVTLRTVLLVLDVEDGESTQVLVSASDDRLWVQRAFLDEALLTLDRAMDRHEDEEAHDPDG